MPVAAPPIVQPRPIIQQPAQPHPPIVLVAPPQTEPSLEIVTVQPERIIVYEHPTRSPERYSEEVRNEPQPKTRHDPETVAPVRNSPIMESNQPDNLETQPVQKKISPDTQQKQFAEPNKKSSPERIETIPNNSPDRIDPELFEPDKPAPQADTQDFKKVGKVVGRQRRNDDLGVNDIEPIRELFLLRYLTGKHWPGLSKDMEAYYDKYYFTRPKKGSKDYAKHVKCWERRTKWIAAHTA